MSSKLSANLAEMTMKMKKLNALSTKSATNSVQSWAFSAEIRRGSVSAALKNGTIIAIIKPQFQASTDLAVVVVDGEDPLA